MQASESPDRPRPEAEGPTPPPAQVADQQVRLRPRPRLRRLSRGAVSAVLIAGLFAIMLLTLRYSRESLAARPASSASTALGPPPVSLEHLERLRTQRPRLVEPPDVVPPSLPAPAAAPAARMPPSLEPRRRRPAAYRAPLSPSGGGSPARARPTAGSAERPALEEELARLERELGIAGNEPSSALAPRTARPGAGRAQPGSSALAAWVPPATEFLLRSGTTVPAVLSHRLVSDQPGLVRAVVSRDIYDTVSGQHVLIPRGTVLLGDQSNLPTLGQSRLAVSWSRLLLPDGRSLNLAEEDRAPAASAAVDGSLGLPGAVRQHWGRRYGAAALLSLIGAGVQLSQPDRGGGAFASPSPGEEAAGALGVELGQLSQEILRRHVDIPPTIELRPGARVSAILVQDLAFLAPYRPLVP